MKSIYHSETLSLSKRSHIAFENNEWKKIIFKSLEYEKIFITTDAVCTWHRVLLLTLSVNIVGSQKD
eukprot:jgi/Galph1/3982/GphlegSOOS_G2609.1